MKLRGCAVAVAVLVLCMGWGFYELLGFRAAGQIRDVKVGMTAAELGRVFPHRVSAICDDDQLPTAKQYFKEHPDHRTFSGSISFVFKSKPTYTSSVWVDEGIARGDLQIAGKDFPEGSHLRTILDAADARYEVKVQPVEYPYQFDVDLRTQSHRLKNFSGNLSLDGPIGLEDDAWFSIDLRNGRVTSASVETL